MDQINHSLTPCTKINLKWVKYLNIRPEMIKLLEENIDCTLFDIDLSNNFWICFLWQKKRKES